MILGGPRCYGLGAVSLEPVWDPKTLSCTVFAQNPTVWRISMMFKVLLCDFFVQKLPDAYASQSDSIELPTLHRRTALCT